MFWPDPPFSVKTWGWDVSSQLTCPTLSSLRRGVPAIVNPNTMSSVLHFNYQIVNDKIRAPSTIVKCNFSCWIIRFLLNLLFQPSDCSDTKLILRESVRESFYTYSALHPIQIKVIYTFKLDLIRNTVCSGLRSDSSSVVVMLRLSGSTDCAPQTARNWLVWPRGEPMSYWNLCILLDEGF